MTSRIKRFSIDQSVSKGMTETIKAASNYAGALHVEVVPLESIILDENNPRTMALTIDDLKNGISKDDDKRNIKEKEKLSLASMVHSIKTQGVINPIIVFRHKDMYQLVSGERRTLSSFIAGKTDIPAKILTSKPDLLKLSLLQWIENIEREDLSLWDRIKNIEKIMEAHSNSKDNKKCNAKELSQLLGCSLQQGANYKNLVDAPTKIKLQIKSGKIKNVEKAALIARTPADNHDSLIKACLDGASLKKLKQLIEIQEKKESLHKQNDVTERRGRNSTKVNFGTTKNTNVAKIIIESVVEKCNLSSFSEDIKSIDWADYRAVSTLFQSLLKSIDK